MTRINTNIASLRGLRSLNRATQLLDQSLARLSTGLKINSGKDDPSGLIASETLRLQITAIEQSIKNSNRANNVIATADAALNEIGGLLNQIRGLVQEGLNTGALSQAEIEANQLQIDSALSAINRIASNTKFGSDKLIDGSKAFVTSVTAADAAKLSEFQINEALFGGATTIDIDAEVLTAAEKAELLYDGTAPLAGDTTIEISGSKGSQVLFFGVNSTVDHIVDAINAVTDATGVEATLAGSVVTLSSQRYGSDHFVSVNVLEGAFATTLNDGLTDATRDEGVDIEAIINGQVAVSRGLKAAVKTATLDASLTFTEAANTVGETATVTLTGGGSLFQIGQDVSVAGQVGLGIDAINTARLGGVTGKLYELGTGGGKSLLDIGPGVSGSDVVQILHDALDKVSTLRGRLGSLQKNVIETNIATLGIALENISEARSEIIDTDFAAETAALTRAQILSQSGIAVLGIANQNPAQVLALLG